MKVGIVVFPGSNCDYDVYHAVHTVMKHRAEYIWHKDTTLHHFDAIVLQGGFSYGDYLRTGAEARFSPVMGEIIKYAKAGNPVLGICNGFQILLESGLLPGALITNNHLRFRCEEVQIKTINTDSVFTNEYIKEQILKIPIAHHSGNYFADEETIKVLKENDRIAFQYCDAQGEITQEANPNGSILNIAGIFNEEKNILGMMPHPERAVEQILGSVDGIGVFQSILRNN